MSNPFALLGVDAAWLAVDSAGQVAIFTTAGEGPLPEAAVLYAATTEELVWLLPEISEVELRTSVPRPDDFIAFARRGLYAYDWSDVHRVASQSSGCYELQAVPRQPAILTGLPAELRRIAAVCRTERTFGGAQFNPSAVGI